MALYSIRLSDLKCGHNTKSYKVKKVLFYSIESYRANWNLIVLVGPGGNCTVGGGDKMDEGWLGGAGVEVAVVVKVAEHSFLCLHCICHISKTADSWVTKFCQTSVKKIDYRILIVKVAGVPLPW